ncbi:MAG: glycosyltransferase family 2 protein [Candidatus Hydrogenedentota bacterium]
MNSLEPNNLALSIIIPAHNRRDDLAECLGAMPWDQFADRHVEVIVVDDASADGTAAMVHRDFPDAHVIALEDNAGPARARNRGAKEARGNLLWFLDSDGAITPGWLDAVLAADGGHTVLLGCVVDYEGGRVQRVPRRATFLGKSLRCRPHRANTGPSCNLGVPRACFDALGGFDEELPYYFEDSDFCIRARKAGYSFRYLPNAVFRHKGSSIIRGNAITPQERNSTYAMLRAYHGHPLRRIAFTLANGLWLVTRIVTWGLRGRFRDVQRVVSGWRQGYQAYTHWRKRGRT